MTLETSLRFLAQAIYFYITLSTFIWWKKQADEARRDIFLVFLILSLAILSRDIQRLSPELASSLTPVFWSALLLQPWLVLRVARYLTPIPPLVWKPVLMGLVPAFVSLALLQALPMVPVVIGLGYVLASETAAALLLLRGARQLPGFTGSRMRMAALGSALLVLIFLISLVVELLRTGAPLSPMLQSILEPGLQFLAIFSGIAWYFGFSPPRWLCRLSQLNQLEGFLRRLSGSEADRSTLSELLPSAARDSVGASSSLLARWDEAAGVLRSEPPAAPWSISLTGESAPAIRGSWEQQRSMYIRLPDRLDPDLNTWAAQAEARALYLVPVVGSLKPWGMLILALRHLPLFSRDDLDLLALLCEQGALQLEHAALVEQLQAANRSLEERVAERERAEAKFRGLLEAAPDSIIVVDQQGLIQLVNSQVESMFGFSRAELLGRSIELLVPKRFQKKHARHRDGYRVHHHARPMGSGLELFAVRKDGHEFPVEISLSPLEMEGSLLIMSAIRDVTRRKNNEEKIRSLNQDLERRAAQLEASNKELESFSYSVSHDLRAPLRSIDGFSQAVLEDYSQSLPLEGRNYLERVRAAARRMAELIDDLLNLSRLTRAALHLRFINLSAMVQEVLGTLKEQNPDRQVQVSITPDLMVEGDPHLLRIAMDNLLGNAWKFTSRRSQASIEFGQQAHAGEPGGLNDRIFYVRDNGVGFDMTYVDRLFDVFQRLHSVSEFPGTGVGLATVQRIIKMHGGRIWAESVAGQGATFFFTLNGESHGQENEPADRG